MLRRGLKVGDIILAAVMLVTALCLFALPYLSAGSAESAEIVLVGTGEVRAISLTRDATYTVESGGVTLVVCVSEQKVSVTDADCRDGICRRTPPISRPGQSIVCAPAGVVVRIIGEEAIVDGVSG